MLWGHRGLDRLITTPKEAINVFDFEPVMFKNVPPAHFGYMASGIDDEMTLRANREGFQKFVLRPRRLVDVRKVDMSVDILGERYPTPDHAGAGRRPQGMFTPKASSTPPAAPRPATTCRSCRPSTTAGVEDVTAARGAPIWYQLYATNSWDVAKALRGARREGRLPGGRGDGRPQRRPQPGDPVPAARASTRAIATIATTAPA